MLLPERTREQAIIHLWQGLPPVQAGHPPLHTAALSMPCREARAVTAAAVATPSVTAFRSARISANARPCPKAKPREKLRDCIDVAVSIRSPMPDRPMKVCGLPPQRHPQPG